MQQKQLWQQKQPAPRALWGQRHPISIPQALLVTFA
jgi:hypothetical protein